MSGVEAGLTLGYVAAGVATCPRVSLCRWIYGQEKRGLALSVEKDGHSWMP